MRFYFDESGDFSPPKQQAEHKAAVVVGVDIPETVEQAVFDAYDRFVVSLTPAELHRNEPKGRLLTNGSRKRFSETIAGHESTFVTPSILDLSTLADGRAQAGIESLIRKLNDIAPQCVYESMAKEVRLLARQIANTSVELNLRILAVARCLFHTLKHCILFRSGAEYDACWDSIEANIDPIQATAGSRERIVFERLVLGWMTAWTQSEPIITIKEIHTSDHPFIRRYRAPGGGIDLGTLMRDRIHWPTSFGSRGIQIADICATINSLAVRRIVNAGDLRNYGTLMRRNVLAPEYAPGIFIATDDPIDLGDRYRGLVEAIKNARERTEN